MRTTILALTILILILSCGKERNENFKQVTISGSVSDSSNRVKMPNVPIRIYWVGPGVQETPIGLTSTDDQGNYFIKTSIDINRFTNQVLDVAALIPNGFISIHDKEHPTIGASTVGYAERIYLPHFTMYQQANLKINLQRSFNDTYTDFQLYYNYGGRDYWVNFATPNPTGLITYTVPTAARVPTKVYWVKKHSSGATTTFQDSIICLPNTGNAITISY